MAEVLKKSEVFIAGTDTIPGVFCSAFDAAALERIFALKGRDMGKPMALYTLEPEVLAEMPNGFEVFVKTAPITFVLPIKPEFLGKLGECAKYIVRDGYIGVRVIKIKQYDILAGTSANFSGFPSPKNFEDISPEFVKKVDFAINSPKGCGNESSVLKFYPDGTVEVLREGYDFSKLKLLIKNPTR